MKLDEFRCKLKRSHRKTRSLTAKHLQLSADAMNQVERVCAAFTSGHGPPLDGTWAQQWHKAHKQMSSGTSVKRLIRCGPGVRSFETAPAVLIGRWAGLGQWRHGLFKFFLFFFFQKKIKIKWKQRDTLRRLFTHSEFLPLASMFFNLQICKWAAYSANEFTEKLIWKFKKIGNGLCRSVNRFTPSGHIRRCRIST